MPYRSVGLSSHSSASDSASINVSWDTADSSSACGPATGIRVLDGVVGSCLWPGPVLPVGGLGA